MDKIEHYQMLDEIRVMRELKYCANTLKLLKIYESEKYINFLLEYHEGGTLAERLER
jgi:serine/threonine protein kinase